MRKLYLVLLCLVAAVTSLSAKQVWFDNAETNWTTPAVYYWGGGNPCPNWDGSKEMTQVAGTSIYGYDVPDDITGMKFRDLSGGAQTAGDITTIPENGLWKGTANSNNGTYTPGGETPTPTPTKPWADNLFIKGSWAGSTWIYSKFNYDADSDSWKASIDVTEKAFDFGLYNDKDGSGENPWFGASGIITTPDVANDFNFSGSNGKASGFTTDVTYTVVLRLTGDKSATLEFVSPVIEPETFWLSGETIGWFHEGGGKQFTEQPNGTFTLELGDVAKGSQFKFRGSKSSNYWTLQDVTGTHPAEVSFVTEGLQYGAAQFDADFTDVVFTYTPGAEKPISITGTKVVTLVDIYMRCSTNSEAENDSNWKFSSEDGVTYTFGPIEVAGGFFFQLNTPKNEWTKDFAISGSLAEDIYLNDNDYNKPTFKEGNYKNVTFTYNYPENKMVVDGKRVAQTGTITAGKYVLGNTFYIHYRNDADLNADWTVEEIPFDKWNEKTNPNGLELHKFEFRANARTIPFYITNEHGEVINANKVFTLENFGTFGFPGTDEEEAMESCYSFQGLILGENYRVVCKIKETGNLKNESVATAQTHCLLGIFKPATTYPWGDTPQNLHIHGNLEGSWHALGVLGGIKPEEDTDGCANVTTGPEFTYNANTDIWYLDFKLGNPQTLNNGTGEGWEFDLTDEFGIQWYKADIELPYGVWTDGAMNIQTEDNDRNFYIRNDNKNFKSGETYRMQIRKNAATGVWQMRVVVKPEFNDALYIKSPENEISAPVVMPHAVDVEGNDIEGYYIYTMPYKDATKFQISKSDTDFDGQLIYADNGQPACVLGTPYGIYDDGSVSEWTAEGNDLGMISVVVNYNTGALRVYSPSVLMQLASRHVERIPGKFDGAKFGVPASDLYNNVEGATDEHPVTFDRVNSISINLALTNLFFDRDCELTLTGLKINNSNVDRIAGRKFKLTNGAEGDKTAINNHIFHIPYSGHLTVDGQFDTTQPKYTFELSYTISKNGVTKENTTTLVYEPNFQPYFVRPRPVADSDQNYTGSLLVQNAWLGNNNWAAVANRAIQFSGNTGDVDAEGNPIYYDYSGIPGQDAYDLDKARIGVYPGFKVTVDGVEAENYHIPVGADKSNITKFSLKNYGGGDNLDWSSAALAEGQLPVMVSLNSNNSADWLYEMQEGSRLKYQVFAHYPLYVFKGGICADKVEDAVPTDSELNEAAEAAAKAPVKRVHTSDKDSEGACNIPDHVGVHSIVAARTFTGMTKLEQSTTGIEGVEVETEANQAAPEYYNLQGIRVANPAPGNVYILRQGNTTTKVRL